MLRKAKGGFSCRNIKVMLCMHTILLIKLNMPGPGIQAQLLTNTILSIIANGLHKSGKF